MNTASDRESHRGGLPTIIADHRLEAQSEEAALSLTLRKGIYQRYGQLVRVVEDTIGLIREKGAPIIEAIPLETLRTKSRNNEDRTPATYGGFLGRFVSQTTNHGPISAPSQALSRV